MSSVISATTGAAYGTVPVSPRRDAYLDAARDLLQDALRKRERGECDLALESAYRAALRTAGAVLEGSVVIAKRKRLPTSAWAKLELTGARGKHWAGIFNSYSRLRGRVASGIELDPDAAVVNALIGHVVDFFNEVSGERTDLAVA